MKFLLRLVLVIYCMPIFAQNTPPAFSTAEEAKQAIPKILDQIPQLLKDDPTGIKAQQFLRKDRLPQWIQNYFYAGGLGPLHEFSAERQVRVNEIEQILLPYEKMLIDLSLLTKDDNSESGIALQFLNYTSATPILKSTLLNLSRESTSNIGLIEKSYDTIYSHKMDDAQFIKNTIDFIVEHRDTRSINSAVASALYSSSRRAALPEMKDIYLNDLAVPLRSENYINGSRSLLISRTVAAAQGLAYFGLLGGDTAVNLLRARLLELDLNSGDEQNAKLIFEDTIERVLGNRPPELAISRKGQLLGISNEAYSLWKKKSNYSSSSTRHLQHTATATPDQILSPKLAPLSNPKRQSDLVKADQPPVLWPWIIGAILLLAVVGGILFKFLRK